MTKDSKNTFNAFSLEIYPFKNCCGKLRPTIKFSCPRLKIKSTAVFHCKRSNTKTYTLNLLSLQCALFSIVLTVIYNTGSRFKETG